MKKIDWTLLISVIVISVFRILMIYSTSYILAEYKYGDVLKYVKNQGLFFIVGIILLIFRWEFGTINIG